MAIDRDDPERTDSTGPEHSYRTAPDGDSSDSDGRGPDAQHDSTGVPTSTTPRAVLRPVPEGFPTPPPRPARPNRAPALPSAAPATKPRSGRLGLLIAGIAAVALLVGIVGGSVAIRALSGNEEPQGDATPGGTADTNSTSDPTDGGTVSAPAGTGTSASTSTASAPASASAAGSVQMGEVTVVEVSTASGLRSVGTGPSAVEAEGSYTVVTLEVTNSSDRTVILPNTIARLRTSDGTIHPADLDASEAHSAPTEPRGVADAGESTRIHVVFDLPPNAEPASLLLDLSTGSSEASGELTLTP